MFSIQELRKKDASIVVIGSNPGIIQSILDFDYLSGKDKPSITAIVAGGRKYERYFFGKKEVLIPVVTSYETLSENKRKDIIYFLNVTSGRRVFPSSFEAIKALPNLLGGVVFAEDVPEKHSLELYTFAKEKDVFLIGPASVGLLLPGVFKLGAIGGVDIRQLVSSHVFTKGSVAVFSSSGGMTNELINIVSQKNHRLSFALSFGGDRFPLLTPEEAFIAAEEDHDTETIVYFGELGGTDEYELVELIKNKKITKPVICYIGGTVAELFETPPQFGHAKAMAKKGEETARAKRDALKNVGVHVAESFAAFVELIGTVPPVHKHEDIDYTTLMVDPKERKSALITTSISYDEDGDVKILGEDLLAFTKGHTFAFSVASLLLGKQAKSKELVEFVDFVLRLLVDHGPYVSGAVNTIVTARAGKDLVSSLTAGLLTIGPRFGGAINQAAVNWINGVVESSTPHDFVEDFSVRKEYIAGIGHRKYRIDLPDPRVSELLTFSETLEKKRFTSFALDVQSITVAKKGNLILNVDGTIAAVLLDILSEKEELTDEELKELTRIEFFNALFVLSRSVGFTAHFLDQKRLDEGLFRLGDDQVLALEPEDK